jgi:hypothetical protein
MLRYVFRPNLRVVGRVKPTHSIQDLDKETCVYSASVPFIRKHCGPITNSIIDKIPKDYYDEAKELGLFVNCDVRLHRLYPGDYPAYPGWHADGNYRENYFSQPDLDKVKINKHITAVVSSHESGVSNTEFLTEELQFETSECNQENPLWHQVDKQVRESNLQSCFIPDGDIVLFDSWTLHRPSPAKIRGWRLFLRISMWHKPFLEDEGKFSKQETIYIDVNKAGW